MHKYIHIFIFILLSPLSPLAENAFASTVQGIVLDPNGPVPHPVVHAYTSYDDLVSQQNGISSKKGIKPGEYTLDLAEGRYYFTATGASGTAPLYSFHGLNPITVTDELLWLPFFTSPETKATCEDGFQGIGGTLTFKGQRLQSGSVSVYTLEDEPFRGMGVLTNTIEKDSPFWFDLEPGMYVVMARQRQDSNAIGPLKKGDLFCYSSANPITVSPAKSCTVELACYPRDNINAFLEKSETDPRGKKERQRRSASLESASMQATATTQNNSRFSIIAGRVTDLDGVPRPDLFVSAYPADDLFLFQMYIVRFKSNFIARTDRNGIFRLEVPAGPYYLVARERVGEAPISGEYYGLYEGSPNHSLKVESGMAINNLQIITGPIMP